MTTDQRAKFEAFMKSQGITATLRSDGEYEYVSHGIRHGLSWRIVWQAACEANGVGEPSEVETLRQACRDLLSIA